MLWIRRFVRRPLPGHFRCDGQGQDCLRRKNRRGCRRRHRCRLSDEYRRLLESSRRKGAYPASGGAVSANVTPVPHAATLVREPWEPEHRDDRASIRQLPRKKASMDYASHEHHDFTGASSQALADSSLQKALVRLTDTLLAGNRRGYAALADSSDLRDRAKRIKEHALAHLDRYLEQLEASVQRLGGKVHWAESAEEARTIVVQTAHQANCKYTVKSKSMTSEEIHLNPALEKAGIEVTETDFGEFIIQVAGERPSHLVAPAVHHSRESVARVLSQHLGEPLADDPQSLALTGRRVLRQKFRRADLGITGANFAVAETGTIVLVTNEGNGRLTTTCPRVHVALMGIEKVIPRLADLPVFLKLLARAATGQTLSVYTTLLTGPRRMGELDGPDEFHLVILDNGRSRILGSPFRESLECIRCGACLNACPVYRRIGGHAYGGVYSGPIGSIL